MIQTVMKYSWGDNYLISNWKIKRRELKKGRITPIVLSLIVLLFATLSIGYRLDRAGRYYLEMSASAVILAVSLIFLLIKIVKRKELDISLIWIIVLMGIWIVNTWQWYHESLEI